jgi:anti-sigma factor RsiW
MTTVEHHISFERINNLVDGRLLADERRLAEAHLAVCEVCEGQRARLAALLGAAHALSDVIQPPVELWRGVHGGIMGRQPLGLARRPWRLAAAALLLIAVSSGITVLFVKRPQVVVVEHEEPRIAAVGVGARARSVDADYAAVIRELGETLAQRRAQLDPRTIAKVEASLRVIDEAIDEARSALAADPANLTLVDLLSASYERKLELLRRATELSPST